MIRTFKSQERLPKMIVHKKRPLECLQHYPYIPWISIHLERCVGIVLLQTIAEMPLDILCLCSLGCPFVHLYLFVIYVFVHVFYSIQEMIFSHLSEW